MVNIKVRKLAWISKTPDNFRIL